MRIKAYTPYVPGIVGHDFHLSFWQKVKILFSSSLSVVFLSDNLRADNSPKEAAEAALKEQEGQK